MLFQTFLPIDFSLSLSSIPFRFPTHGSQFFTATYVPRNCFALFLCEIFVDLHFIHKMERGDLLLIPGTRNKRLEILLAVTVEWCNFFSLFLKYRLLTHIEIIVTHLPLDSFQVGQRLSVCSSAIHGSLNVVKYFWTFSDQNSAYLRPPEVP